MHVVPPVDAARTAGLPIERRGSPRYPLELEGELQLDGCAVACRSANISSGGLLTICDREVQVGAAVIVRLDWPLRQRNRQVVLVVQGEVVRRAPGLIGILRRQYTFDVRQCS